MSLPILILDLDGTIIGDISYIGILYNLNKLLKKQNIKNNEINKYISNLYNEKSSLVRPYFCDFINHIKKQIPSILIYIYTASEKVWANTEMKIIEKNCNIKFERPIFTREYCIIKNNVCSKSLSKIFPIIKKKHKERVDIDNIFIIDNNNVYIDIKNNISICPHYNFLYFIDIWHFVPKYAIKNTMIYTYLINYVKSGYINPCSTHILSMNGKEDLKSKYHNWLGKKYKLLHEHNSLYNTDIYWKLFKDLLVEYNIRNFYDNNFKSLKLQLNSVSKN